jgi:hypothetical protein
MGIVSLQPHCHGKFVGSKRWGGRREIVDLSKFTKKCAIKGIVYFIHQAQKNEI